MGPTSPNVGPMVPWFFLPLPSGIFFLRLFRPVRRYNGGYSAKGAPVKLNVFEKALMNSPFRWMTQRFGDVPRFLELGGGPMNGGRALELGCGRGVGVGMIRRHFRPARIDAFDLDPHMVDLARTRHRGTGARFWIGDAARLAVPEETYDAVFDFGIIHHIPGWQAALPEVMRVLKPGGRFFVFEVLADFIRHPLWRVLMDHPQENRFDHDRFRDELLQTGFQVMGTRSLRNQFGWFAARKP